MLWCSPSHVGFNWMENRIYKSTNLRSKHLPGRPSWPPVILLTVPVETLPPPAGNPPGKFKELTQAWMNNSDLKEKALNFPFHLSGSSIPTAWALCCSTYQYKPLPCVNKKVKHAVIFFDLVFESICYCGYDNDLHDDYDPQHQCFWTYSDWGFSCKKHLYQKK